MQQISDMRKLICLGLGLMFLLLADFGTAWAAPPVPLPDDVPWYNVSRPLTWSDLQGRVVLLDFLTPGCINCVHMIPVEETLADRFGKRLVIIGVDAPKFTDLDTTAGLEDFIKQYHIRHPVFLDKDLQFWKAWRARAWPTLILIGPDGKPQGRVIGEGSVSDLAGPIREALADAPPVRDLKPLPKQALAMSDRALDSPGGIAVTDKWVAVSDTGDNRVVLAHRDGQVKAVIGGCDKSAFERPHGLVFHNNKLYIADTRGARVRVVDPATQAVSTLAGSGKRAYVAHGRYPARQASFNSPWDVQWADGGVYISMAGDHDIWRYDPETGQVGPWAGSGREGLHDGDRHSAQFAQSSGLDVHAGTLYVADPESSAIRAVNLKSGEVQTLVGQGLFKFGLQNGPASGALLQHAEDAVWLDDSLYIADTFNNALRRLDLKNSKVTTIATGLKQPQALAVFNADTLLVAEAGGNRIVSVHLPDGETRPWPIKGLKAPTCADTAADTATHEAADSAD
jgi:thiol-disulfide isomerase/thioredoxin